MGRLLSIVGAALGLNPSEHVTVDKQRPMNKVLEPKTENGDDEIEDCTACKLIGSTTMTVCGVYCIATAWRNPKQLSGSTLNYLRIAGYTMGTSFIVLASCRFFNLGPFAYLKSPSTSNKQ
ncbi:hypothetical protein LSH36_43g07007 [Paralvinella palmiformis]|uniref:DUF4536 domain-containing protein n=1 Tax=Paralvinella palmiformis TaxID=53620 RepID=A0AAD9NG93_9ANNE|nr:hypothetical protein LSH36_43g07007 [Paralvinella palmiformis]